MATVTATVSVSSNGPFKFRKKPVEIEAIKFTGDNWDEVKAFTGKDWFKPRPDSVVFTAWVYDVLHETWVSLRAGDYVIKGIKGEFYPCDPQVLADTYEMAA